MFVCRLVKMKMRVTAVAVTVSMNVNSCAAPQSASESGHAQSDNHQCHAELQPTGDALRDRDPKSQHHYSNRYQRRCMTGAPQSTDERRPSEPLVFAENSRDRHDVIDFGSVFQTVNETDAEHAQGPQRT